ncbi:MAG TPA: ThuA domain-containing protein [Spirochaetes bacterium]|mgnify:CR=1 FL=1|nr:ThuA domain-containing protein [Spirochaetota bacterium]
MKKKLLVVSDGIIHPSIPARARFRKFLTGIAGVDCVFARSIEAVCALGEGGFDAVTVYLHRKVISDGALKALEDFVRGGGGFLPVHSASASFKTRDRYFDVVGGRFIGHGRIEPFSMRRVHDGIFNGIEDYTVRDELYLHEYDRTNTVHFVTDTDQGSEPQVWTRSYGKGRVCYYAPGHCAPTMKHPGTIEVLARGLRWVCGLEGKKGG